MLYKERECILKSLIVDEISPHLTKVLKKSCFFAYGHFFCAEQGTIRSYLNMGQRDSKAEVFKRVKLAGYTLRNMKGALLCPSWVYFPKIKFWECASEKFVVIQKYSGNTNILIPAWFEEGMGCVLEAAPED